MSLLRLKVSLQWDFYNVPAYICSEIFLRIDPYRKFRVSDTFSFNLPHKRKPLA